MGVAVGVGVGLGVCVGLGVAAGVSADVAVGLGAAEATAVVALALGADDGGGVTPVEPPQPATTIPMANSPANVRRMDIGGPRATVRCVEPGQRGRLKFGQHTRPNQGVRGRAWLGVERIGRASKRARARRSARLRQHHEAATGERPKDVEVTVVEGDDGLRLIARRKDHV